MLQNLDDNDLYSSNPADSGNLYQNLTVIPPVSDAETAEKIISELKEQSDSKSPNFSKLISENNQVTNFLLGVFSNSTFLRDLGMRDLDRLYNILTGNPIQNLTQLINETVVINTNDESELMRQLRCNKQYVALATGLADLGGVLTTMQVTKFLSKFADASVTCCMQFCLADLVKRGRYNPINSANLLENSGWFALAMGKHGAYELNYSSDIDIIVLFEPEKSRLPEDVEVQVEYVRLTKRLVKLMQERTADGYVFRTDLRLRPDPSATPPAISVPAALIYYESLGQNWERAALIKARPIGDIETGQQFLKDISPFIWRKYLDYAAIADVHAMKRQIHINKGHEEIAVSGHNVKLGRGGIREIEFFVQTQQLIAGGRNPELRGRQTLEMLNRLAEHRWIGTDSAEQLQTAYCYLRNVEHRIQMQNDEQTHTLPDSDHELSQISNLMGYENLEGFKVDLRKQLESVQQEYEKLFEDEPGLSSELGNLVFTGDEDDPETLDTLSRIGYKDPKTITKIIRSWHFGRYAATRTNQVRERLTKIQNALVEAFAKTDNPDSALIAFDNFLSHLPAGVQLFSLLHSNQGLLQLLARIMGDAPRMAQLISKRAHVLDSVLDPAFFGAMPNKDEFRQRLEQSLADARVFEDILDRTRIFGQEQMFLIGVRVLSNTLAADQSGEAYARLAEVMAEKLLEAAKENIIERHGTFPDAEIALIAMGKFGGMEMTASSDLDLILIYKTPDGINQSDGEKPLSPSQYFIRLTQRFVTALSAPTAEGQLYEVDLRLRPEGSANSIATQFSSFRSYYKKQARIWERMALTRARIITSTSDTFAKKINQTIASAINPNFSPQELKNAVKIMRQMIEEDKKVDDIWNLKHIPGGLVDLEFIAQYLQLQYGESNPEIISPNTKTVLETASKAGLIPTATSEIVLPAVRLFQKLTQILRLTLSENFKKDEVPAGVISLLAHTGEVPDFQRLEHEVQTLQQQVRTSFNLILDTSK